MDKTKPTESQKPKASDPFGRLRQVVTLGALAMVLTHILWPSLAIDSITLGLLAIAVLPWLAPLVKSIELPGGLKIELQDLKEITDRAKDAGLLSATHDAPTVSHSFQLVADSDPNLALAGLRIEIERRLVTLCEKHDIQVRSRSVRQMLRALDQKEVLTPDQRSALADLTGLLNSAVHGASVDTQAAEWAMEIAPDLLDSLSRLTEPTGPKLYVQDNEPKFAQKGDLWVKPGE